MDTKLLLQYRAMLLWSQRGYDGVGVQEICDAVPVSKPTLYHHFGSKAGLLSAVLERFMNPYRDLVISKAAYAHDITKNLQDLALAWFAQVESEPDFARLYLILCAAGQDSEAAQIVKPWIRDMQASLLSMFAQAGMDHGNMKDREQRYTASFQGLLDAYTRLRISGEIVLEPALVYPITHQFMHGIFS